MFRTMFTLMSPAGQKARLQVLIFHRVLTRADPLFPEEVDRAQFDQICGWLRAWFNVLPLDEAVHCLTECSLPARALAITFDDGYADNHNVALPILQRHGLPATFFIATGFLNGGRMWNDTVIEAVRRTALKQIDLRDLEGLTLGTYAIGTIDEKRAAIDAILFKAKYLAAPVRQSLADGIARRAGAPLPNDLMMTSEQVVALHHAGMQIGAHTVTHPILALLDAEEARAEIAASKGRLEDIVDSPVTLFAYPNGKPGKDYSPESVKLARECGFAAAVSTSSGTSNRQTDLFQLRRFTPWDHQRLRFGLRLARNLAEPD